MKKDICKDVGIFFPSDPALLKAKLIIFNQNQFFFLGFLFLFIA